MPEVSVAHFRLPIFNARRLRSRGKETTLFACYYELPPLTLSLT